MNDQKYTPAPWIEFEDEFYTPVEIITAQVEGKTSIFAR
jgi:hypothetical protein